MGLRSGEPLTRAWLETNRQGSEQRFHKGEIVSARDAMETRRSRQPIGWGAMQLNQPLMEYDMAQLYAGQTWVHISTSNPAATTGTTDPDSGLAVKSTPGWYCSCMNGVPPFYIPQVPLPDSSNVDSPLNRWVIFIGEPMCY
jgi:hypothetical protein